MFMLDCGMGLGWQELAVFARDFKLECRRQAVVDAVKNNICGKVARELVPGTLEVYPIANYGAVEIGVHRFHHPGDKGMEGVGEAKFIHLWQETNGTWKVTRVFSFDHKSAR